jgi:hypothetical protein
LGRTRGGSGRQATQRLGRERSWGLVIVSALVVAFLGAFVVVVVLDARQQAASSPPGGVENINVGPGGQHTEGAVDYAQNPPAGGKFVSAYKQGPQTPEPGAACTGGLADPA